MNWLTISIGVFALGFGIYMTCVRKTNPQKLGKLGAMKQRFGVALGTVHIRPSVVLRAGAPAPTRPTGFPYPA